MVRVEGLTEVGTAARLPGRGVVVGVNLGRAAAPSVGVVRITDGGRLDRSFGAGGVAVVSPGHSRFPLIAARVAVTRDRRVLAGTVDADGAVVLVRLLPDGALDRSFGGGGGVRIAPEGGPRPRGRLTALALAPDARILIAAAHYPAVTGARESEVVARLLPDGALDRSFGAGGVVRTSEEYCCQTFGPLLGLADGRTLAGRHTWLPYRTGSEGVEVISYNRDGTRGPPAWRTRAQLRGIAALAADHRGAVWALGGYESRPLDGIHDEQFALQRATQTEAGGFEAAEPVVFNFDRERKAKRSPLNSRDWPEAMTFDNAGRVLAGGASSDEYGNSSRFALARLTTAGRLDRTFARDGRTLTAFPGHDRAQLLQVTTTSRSRILAIGGDADTILLARYHGGSDRTPPRLRLRLLGRRTCRRTLSIVALDTSPVAQVAVRFPDGHVRRTRRARLRIRIAPAARPIRILARDIAGNTTRKRLTLPPCPTP